MNRDEFEEAVNKKFALKDGWYERDDYVLTTSGKAYEMAYDEGEDGLENPHLEELSAEDSAEYGQGIDGLEDIPVADPDAYFHAKAIMTANGEEYVHIDEPGKWFDHVFINFHDEGLYSIDTIDDDMDWLPDLESREARIEDAPFFQNPVAKTLKEFFDMLVEVPSDEFWGD